MDDQGVRVWNIEPRFDNGGRQQQVVFPVVESRHDVLESSRWHLSVGDSDPHFRNMSVQEILGSREILNARANVERLAAAVTFAQERLTNDNGVEWRNESAHRQAIDRR